jgi:hypothetical protein
MGLAEIFDPADIWGTQQDKRAANAKAAIDEGLGYASQSDKQNRILYQDYLDKVKGTYGGQADKVGQYTEALEQLDPYDAGQFGDNYDKTIDDFYSKFANQRKQQATDAITNSMANAGNMFSSDYTNALAAKQQALASEEWDKAFDKYQADRTRALNEFSTNANIGQQTYSNMYNKNKDLLGMSQNAQDNIMNAFGQYTSNLANQNNTLAQSQMNAANAKAQIENSKKGLLGRIFG